MKKLGFLLVALFALWACGDDDTTPQQEVTCSITAPAEGSIIDLATATSMSIKGDGTVNVGKIESVVLKVNGKVVTEVTKVPFTHDYTFAADQAVGAMKIELTVKGDEGKEKTVTANVTLKKTEDQPAPEPEPTQEIIGELTTPAAGTTFDLKDVTKMTITGKASVNVGTVESIVLKVGNTTITPAPVPATDGTFSYEYTFAADQATGDLVIDLAVKGDKTEVAKTATVTVKLTRTVTPPTATTFTDARDGHVYKFVTIGTQSWMAENLAYLPSVSKPTAATADDVILYFVLNYDGEDVTTAKATAEYGKYGVLYNWNAMMGEVGSAGSNTAPSGIQGACPAGWHIPSLAEWKTMETFVASTLPDVKGNVFMDDFGGESFDLCKNYWSALAGKEGWGAVSNLDMWPDLVQGPQDSFGLNIIPTGMCYHTGAFGFTENSVTFWTTDKLSQGGGTTDFFNSTYEIGYSKFGANVKRAYPVRCVKD